MTQLELVREQERQARDRALDALELSRQGLIVAATQVALSIAKVRGQVTSTDVLREMRAQGFKLDDYDPRWLGAVFRKGKGWRRLGYTPDGSHSRPVSVWAIDERGRS